MILPETPPEFVWQRTCPTMDLSNKSRVANYRIRWESFKHASQQNSSAVYRRVFRLIAKCSQHLGKVTVFHFTNTILYCTLGTAVFLGNRFALLCMHKTVRGVRRMNVHARRTPAMRKARWTNAGHTRVTRRTHAEHALCFRRRRSSAPLAHRERTPSVLLTHVQRAQRSAGVFLACAWRAHRVWPWVI